MDTYEKKYNEALERAQKTTRAGGDVAMEIVQYIFPELAESEDERIRKELIEALKISKTVGELKFILPEPTREECIAYLEKQKDRMTAEELESSKLFQLKLKTKYANGYQDGLAQKEQKPVDKFQEYLNASPAERRKMDMDEILGDNKGHQKTTDAQTTDSNKEADTSDCKYKNLDDIAQEYVDGVRQYNPEPTWDLMQTAVCYGYHYREGEEQKPAEMFEEAREKYQVEWSDNDDQLIGFIFDLLNDLAWRKDWAMSKEECLERLKSIRPQPKQEWSEEDDKMMNRLIDRLNFIQYNTRTDGTSLNISFVNEIEWLKSLRPSWKPSEVCYGAKGDPDPAGVWKPSEEQIKAIESCFCEFGEGCPDEDGLRSLYNDLKKLI